MRVSKTCRRITFFYGIVQHERKEIGVDDGMQANGELMEQPLKIAMLCNDFADVEQRFQLTPGVIKHRGGNCLRRRNREARHEARIAPRGRVAQSDETRRVRRYAFMIERQSITRICQTPRSDSYRRIEFQ